MAASSRLGDRDVFEESMVLPLLTRTTEHDVRFVLTPRRRASESAGAVEDAVTHAGDG
jgi:hypothetical protein